MALVTCPECGRENVSDTALSCPGCGFNVREYYEKKNGLTREARRSGYKDLLEKYMPENIGGTLKNAIVQRLAERLTEHAVSRLPKGQEGRVLLSGSGTGSAVEALIRRTRCPIDVIDISENNLKKTKHWNLTYVRGGRLSMTLSSLSDFSPAQEGYSAAIAVNPGFYEDRTEALQKLAAVLPSGALLILCVTGKAPDGMNPVNPEELRQAAEAASFRFSETNHAPEGKILSFYRI